jgi:hypothetical protein
LSWCDLRLRNAVAGGDFSGWIVVTIHHPFSNNPGEPYCQNDPNGSSFHDSLPQSKDVDHVSLS